MNIYLTDMETNDRFTFPMLPEKINVNSGASFRSYDIMERGEIKFPYGETLLNLSWEGRLPGKKRQGSYILQDKSPKAVQSWWSEVRTNKRKLKLMITGTPINHDVYLQDYEITYEGGFGDCMYSISFVQAKELRIQSEANTAGTGSPPAPSRPQAPVGKTYTVKAGDSLWGIAQSQMGDGSKYPQLYEANREKMDAKNKEKGVAQKYMVWAGQVLAIP